MPATLTAPAYCASCEFEHDGACPPPTHQMLPRYVAQLATCALPSGAVVVTVVDGDGALWQCADGYTWHPLPALPARRVPA